MIMGSFQNLDIQLVYLHTYSLTPKLVFFKANLHSNFEIRMLNTKKKIVIIYFVNNHFRPF